MYSIAEQEYYKGLGLVLTEKDSRKLDLHLKELIGICISDGNREELSMLEGLRKDREALKSVQKKLKAGSLLTGEMIRKILAERKSEK